MYTLQSVFWDITVSIMLQYSIQYTLCVLDITVSIMLQYTLCVLDISVSISNEPEASVLRHFARAIRFLQNVSSCLPDYAVSRPTDRDLKTAYSESIKCYFFSRLYEQGAANVVSLQCLVC
jgi:hypothetical protein